MIASQIAECISAFIQLIVVPHECCFQNLDNAGRQACMLNCYFLGKLSTIIGHTMAHDGTLSHDIKNIICM